MNDRETHTQGRWPEHLPVAQVRIARATGRLEEVVRFYRDALGLEQVGSFENHAGYDGVMPGLPGRPYHLEFTRREGGGPCRAPSKENLFVLYLPDAEAVRRAVARLREHGHEPVEPGNPYWAGRGFTFEDPEGRRVVLVNTRAV